MKKINTKTLAMLALLPLVSTVSFADSLSQVVRQALVSDPALHEAENQWYAEEQQLPMAKAGLLPYVAITGNVNRNYLYQNPTLATNGFNNQYQISLNLTQPIFNLQNWKLVSQAKDAVKSAAATYSAAVQSLIETASTAYFNVLTAKAQLDYTIANKNAMYQEWQTALQKYHVGLIAITDVYEAQSSYESAVALEVQNKNILADKLEDLRAITGRLYTELNALGAQFPLVQPQPANMEAWVHTAENQNYSIKSAEFSTLAAKENIQVQASAAYPTLNLIGAVGQGKIFNAPPVLNGSTTSNNSIGLSMNFPLYQGGLVVASTKQARYQYLAASDALDQTHRTVVTQTRKSYLGITSGISQIQADLKSIQSKVSKLKTTKASYQLGTRTIVDVLNAITGLNLALYNYSLDKYNYVHSIILLKQAAGTLTMEDIDALSQWLKVPTNLQGATQPS